MKRLVVVAAGVAVGLAAGAIWTWLQADRYRADARLLVHATSERLPAVEALAESTLVAANVAQTLHLSAPPHIAAEAGNGSVLTVSVVAGSRERARQIDAEGVVILTQKVPQRFPAASVTVLDPAHVAEQTSPTPGRNLLVTVLTGLLGGLALARALSPMRRQVPPREAGVDQRVERRLRARIDQVARRELLLAQRAGQLAATEQDLRRREQELEARAAALRETAVPDLEHGGPEPQPAAKREPEPEPSSGFAAHEQTLVPDGGWTIDALEDLVFKRGIDDPDRHDELVAYVVYLREYADIAGRLPKNFDSLIADVFLD